MPSSRLQASWLKTLRKWLSQKDSWAPFMPCLISLDNLIDCLSRNQCSASSSWAPFYPSPPPLPLGPSAKVPSHKVPRGGSEICYSSFLPRDGLNLVQVRFGELALTSECSLSVPIEDLQDLQRKFVNSKLFIHAIGTVF